MRRGVVTGKKRTLSKNILIEFASLPIFLLLLKSFIKKEKITTAQKFPWNHSKMNEEDFKCSVCLEFLTVPVKITRCGHSFCGQCLAGMTEVTWPCPECRTVQNRTPDELPRNYGLESIVEKFKSSRKAICATHDLKQKVCKCFCIIIHESRACPRASCK